MRLRAWFAILLILLIALFIAFLPSSGRTRPAAKRIVSMSNLRQIGQAAYLYATDYGNIYPPTLGDLLAVDLTVDIDPSVFASRLNPNRPALPKPGEDPVAWVNANSDYHLLYLGKPYINESGKVVGIETIFSKDGAAVLYGDGTPAFESLDTLIRLASEQRFELRYGKGFRQVRR